jgi:hypothetical protein
MARIDVAFLLTDPDFINTVLLIRRSSAINTYGENVLTETNTSIVAVVQGANTETLSRIPDGVVLGDLITVYYKGSLTAESAGGYADIIVYAGKRYQVFEVPEDYMNHGVGWTMANCKLEAVNA